MLFRPKPRLHLAPRTYPALTRLTPLQKPKLCQRAVKRSSRGNGTKEHLSDTIVGGYPLIMLTGETKSTYQLTLGCISTVLTGCN